MKLLIKFSSILVPKMVNDICWCVALCISISTYGVSKNVEIFFARLKALQLFILRVDLIDLERW